MYTWGRTLRNALTHAGAPTSQRPRTAGAPTAQRPHTRGGAHCETPPHMGWPTAQFSHRWGSPLHSMRAHARWSQPHTPSMALHAPATPHTPSMALHAPATHHACMAFTACRVRQLLPRELLDGAAPCLDINEDSHSITVRAPRVHHHHSFTFDRVFGPTCAKVRWRIVGKCWVGASDCGS
eukprot:58503-Chlamydomonas_euryale.AAC.7